MKDRRTDPFMIRITPEERAMGLRVADIEDRTLAAVFRVALREYAQRRGLIKLDEPRQPVEQGAA